MFLIHPSAQTDVGEASLPLHTKNAVMLEKVREIMNSRKGKKISRHPKIQRTKFQESGKDFLMRQYNGEKVMVHNNCLNVQTTQNRERIESVMCDHQTVGKNYLERRQPPAGPFPYRIPEITIQSGASHGKPGNNETSELRSRGLSSLTNQVTGNFIPESDSDSDSDGISIFEEESKRKLEALRLPYTGREDFEILKYVMKNNNIERVGSLSLWKELESEKFQGVPKRTYQSLKNRFLRNIKPVLLTKYRELLSKEHLEKVLLKFPELKKAIKNKETVVRQVVHARSNRVSKEIQTQTLEPAAAQNPNLGREKPLTKDVETSTAKTTELILEERRESIAILKNQQVETINVTNPSKIDEIQKTVTDIVPLNGSEHFSTSTAVELFIPKNPKSISTQSFQYAKVFDTLKGKTNLNLNIDLVKHNSAFPIDFTGPVKVNILVSVTPIQENEVIEKNEGILRLKENPIKKKKKKIVKRKVKRPVKKRAIPDKCRYVLIPKKDNLNLMNRFCSEILEEFHEEVENNEESSESESELEAEKNIGMVLRSQSRKSNVADVSVNEQNSCESQETVFSVEEESQFGEAIKEILKTHSFVTVLNDETDDDDNCDYIIPRKRQRKCENTSNTLLKNMAGMLSPKSKASDALSNSEKKLSDKI